MNQEPNESQLRQLFAEQRAAEARRLPSFDRLTPVAGSADREKHLAPDPAWRLLGAAGVAVLTAILLVVVPRGKQLTPDDTAAWAQLTAWESATDHLLTGAQASWGTTPTTVTAAWTNPQVFTTDTTNPTEETE
jgi:hypothetical protein